MSPRHKARECALQMLFELETSKAGKDECIESFFRRFEHREDVREYASKLVAGAAGGKRKIDEIIRRFAKNWKISRMAPVDRSVLRLAVFELLEEPETPKSVVIDEAIELAKRFGSEDSGGFVNGILDAAAGELRKDEARSEED